MAFDDFFSGLGSNLQYDNTASLFFLIAACALTCPIMLCCLKSQIQNNSIPNESAISSNLFYK